MNVLPLFKSHHSLGRSILTLKEAGKTKPGFPTSIIDLVKENNIKTPFLIEDSASGFIEAYENFKKIGVNVVFGFRVTATDDLTLKNESELSKEHKIVVLLKNPKGYDNLIKVITKASVDGFYYIPRIDYKNLRELWSENLALAIPFYDSFLYRNIILGGCCVPDLTGFNPVFFMEDNCLPFDWLIQEAIEKYTGNNFRKLAAKSIYYNTRKDFKAYLTNRCINNRSTLDKPEMEHLSSAEFCFESWKEKNV